ncbi:MAG TPA: DinB family protein [Vicinamibacterales bacterium]|jgi:hypothetical protein|nr:DinB family protein [Vicinamibacterales bacterium]
MRHVLVLATFAALMWPISVRVDAQDASAFTKHFELLQKRALAAAEEMPEEGYAARAVPAVRTLGEAVGHSIDTNFGVCAGARGLESPKKGTNHEKAAMTKATLVATLRESFEYCRAFVADAAATQARPTDVTFLLTHNAQMLTIMEMQLIARGVSIPASEAAVPAAAPIKK